MSLNDEESENTREALRMDGWYALVRTRRGLRRIPATLETEWEDDMQDSETIVVQAHATVRGDEALGGRFAPVLGVFHPLLLPDALDRGEPRAE